MEDELQIAKVLHTCNTNGLRGKVISDMVWIDGIPHIVLNWSNAGKSASVPGSVVPLDPAKLEKIDPAVWGADWLYEEAIGNPRA